MMNGKEQLIKLVGKSEAERYLRIIKAMMKQEVEKKPQVISEV
jgi:hypothetical protein